MNPHERRRWLLDVARADGMVEVTAATAQLGIAPETLRRDLNLLEQKGLVRRVYGGAVSVESLGFEDTLVARSTLRADEKARIAAVAVERVLEADSVFLDEGSTAQAVADRLVPSRDLTVVTAALPIATVLAPRKHLTVLLLGGRVRGSTFGTVDHWASQMLSAFTLDLAVLGCNGLTLSRGLTAPDPAVAAVKSAGVAASRHRLLVADHSKFGSDSFCRFATITEIDTIVSDSLLPDAMADDLRANGRQLVLA